MELFKIHPSIGIARLGNSTESFYLAPTAIGGLPTECDNFGNEGSTPIPVHAFKDSKGCLKRQGAKFKIYRYDKDPQGTEVTLDDPDVKNIAWTVHIANKKAAFWNFAELVGNTLIDPDNTYENGAEKGWVTMRNASVQGHSDRQKLIIDPGPRSLAGRNQATDFSAATAPADYPFVSFPPAHVPDGLPVKTLGDMRTDEQGNLVVVAAYGNSGGSEPITSYAGADSWHDDTADGQVTALILFNDGSTVSLDAWVMCASPKYAPQLVNITTVADDMFDVAVRTMNYNPEIYTPETGWNKQYVVNFQRDIQPIFNRIKDYIWVANVQSMLAFTNPPFNPADNSPALLGQRRDYFSYWRRPSWTPDTQMNELWDERMLPLMPLNSGTNSVTNQYISKFLTLTETQYFFLGQWAEGYFNTIPDQTWPGLHAMDWASVGNCAGLPLSPGIETTWNVFFPSVYRAPMRVAHAYPESYYFENGLSPDRNELAVTGGCEPGDLSKRMAIPWQADFFQCTVQFVNFTRPEINKDGGVPAPPTYYAYWWPPQAPWNVMSGSTNEDEQLAQGIPAGLQVNYARGINSFSQMMLAWKYLGFILNQNTAPNGRDYPYFVEKERNDNEFINASVAVGSISDSITGDNSNFIPTWFLKDNPLTGALPTGKSAQAADGEAVADLTLQDRKIRIRAKLGAPRSGSNLRV